MRIKVLTIALSLIAFIGLFISTPINKAHASEVSNKVSVQQSTKYITNYSVSFTSEPPSLYYYNNGTYHGWLSLEDWYGTSPTRWVGIYEGTVSTGSTQWPTKLEL